MENNSIQINNFELLGRVLDGTATISERKNVLFNMQDTLFEECLLVAMRTTTMFNEKVEVYEKVQ